VRARFALRERDAYVAGHVSGAIHLPRGQLEIRVND
jgi:rhodanese-related sulfurtransferase